MLARSRKQETDLGRLLDPARRQAAARRDVHSDVSPRAALSVRDPDRTPSDSPGWIVAIVLGREVFMTVFRQAAKRRGVVIAAIGPAKWKTAFQLVWQGCAYCWFFAATLAAAKGWTRRQLARVRPAQRHRRHARRWSAPSSSRCIRWRSTCEASATSSRPHRSDARASNARARPASRSSPSVTSCCSASRSTRTPRISPDSSRRSACTSCGAPRSATTRPRSDVRSAKALERTGAVITTGGLGPTSDDLSKESVAALFGRGMHLDEEHLAWMEERWVKRFNRPLPAGNRRQAMIPDGAEKLENRHGSAPGIWLEDDRGRWVAMLPGVPSEMRGMLADTLLPRLQ